MSNRKYLRVSRKNMGKQFTVTAPPSRTIIHWFHRDDPVPQYIVHSDEVYELTSEALAEAARTGTAYLLPLTDHKESRVIYEENLKGTIIGIRAPSVWGRLKAWFLKQVNKLKGVFA